MAERTRFPFPENLLRRMAPQPDGCIYFTGQITKEGYGRLRVRGTMTLAHRASYEHFVGPIPEGMVLDHECHNRSDCKEVDDACLHRRCVNPQHVAPKTQRENTHASPNTVNGPLSERTHCIRGHEFTEANTYVSPTRAGRVCRACRNDRVNRHRELHGRR